MVHQTWLSAAVVALALTGCDQRSTPTPPEASSSPGPAGAGESCPSRWRQDPARADRIRGLLSSTQAGGALLKRAPRPIRICFHEIEVAAVTTDGVFVLDPRTPEAESAARLGHLMLHLVEGGVLRVGASSDRSCEQVVDDALWAEARAHSLELELRRVLNVERPSHAFPFERVYWSAPADQRVQTLHDYFRDHPEGADGIPGFVRGYAARCRSSLDRGREK